LKKKKTTSSKTIAFDNEFLDELRDIKKIKYHHINLLAYLKDRATLTEGGVRFIKEITLNEINKFLQGDVKCRTAKKLLKELTELELIYIPEDVKLKPKEVFKLTLDSKVTSEKGKIGNFTKLPESLIHKYPTGISTYLAIRKYHSEIAKISIPQIQKASKVSQRNLQYDIINYLESLKFINIGRGGYNTANTYKCMDYDKVEFERTYNKFNGRPKKVLDSVDSWKSLDSKDKVYHGTKHFENLYKELVKRSKGRDYVPNKNYIEYFYFDEELKVYKPHTVEECAIEAWGDKEAQ
jgi:hypothetical protein